MELRQYFSVLLRWWLMLALIMVLAGGAAFTVSKIQEPLYLASVTLLISEAPGGKTPDFMSLMTSERLARTYVEMLTARPILEQVAARLKLPFDAAALVDMIKVQLVRDTQLIRLHVEDINPERAAMVANLLPEVFIAYNQTTQAGRFAETKKSLADEIASLDAQIDQMQVQIAALGKPGTPETSERRGNIESDLTRLRQSRAGLVQTYENQRLIEAQTLNNVIIIEKATVPTYPIRPRTLINVVLAVTLGLVLAMAAVFLFEYMDDSVKNADQITTLLKVPVIGVMAQLSSKDMEHSPIAYKKPRAPITEAFRSLRSNIQFAGIDRPVRRILVTSVGPQEGKSTIATNLAIVMAQAGHSVAILDCDLHRPSQHQFFGQMNRQGLSEIIFQEPLSLNEAVRSVDIPNLSLLPAGVVPPNPAELLGSKKMGQLLDLISQQKDFIVLDSPPLSALTDATVLANKVDGVVLVVEAGRTHMPGLVHAKQQLARAGANIIGVVLNKVPIHRRDYYFYHYNYDYYYSYRKRPALQYVSAFFSRLFGWRPRRVPVEPKKARLSGA